MKTYQKILAAAALAAAVCTTALAQTVQTSTLGNIDVPNHVRIADWGALAAGKANAVIEEELAGGLEKGAVWEAAVIQKKQLETLSRSFNMYQLLLMENDSWKSAALLSVVVPEKEYDKQWKPFMKNKLGREEQNAITAANLMLLNGQALIDQILREENRSGMDVRITLEDMTPVHRLDGAKKIVYTAGSEALLYVDGFELPAYVRAYVLERKGRLAVNLLIAYDPERRAAAEAADAIFRSVDA